MPIGLRVAESTNSTVETGSFVEEIEVEGESLKRLIEVQETVNKQNNQILRGTLHQEHLDARTSIQTEGRSNNYALKIDRFHGLDISPATFESQDSELLKEKVKTVTTEEFIIIGDWMAYTFDNTTNLPAQLNDILDIDFEEVSIQAGYFQEEFNGMQVSSWSDVDENISLKTVSGDLEESEEYDSMSNSGDLTWAMGEIEFQDGGYKIGISSEQDSIIVYGVSDLVQAAEIAIDLLSR